MLGLRDIMGGKNYYCRRLSVYFSSVANFDGRVKIP